MEKVTPQIVRDAIITCFYEAHCANTGLGEDEITSRQYCMSLVKKIFDEQHINFENPTKEGIVKAVNALAEFSKNFRSQEVIQKHRKQIMDMLVQMED